MIGFTKERIEQFIKSPLEHGLTRSEQMEMARQLLAGLEQEPYGYVHKAVYESEGSCGLSSDHEACRDSLTHIPLYAAPQLPQPAVVPQELNTRTANDVMNEHLSWKDYGDAEVFCIAWNACRAVMLQGAEPVSQPYTLRDGWVAVPVEPTEDMVIHGFESVPHPLFQPADWDKYQTMSGCEQAAHRAKLCWAAMVKAAPRKL